MQKFIISAKPQAKTTENSSYYWSQSHHSPTKAVIFVGHCSVARPNAFISAFSVVMNFIVAKNRGDSAQT